MNQRTLIVFLTCLAVALSMATCADKDGRSPRNTLATAEETVKAYCDLDAKGVRLTSATWSQVLPYISWTEEAGFDRAVVIAGFSLGKIQQKNDQETAVSVEYQVVGVLSGDYAAAKRSETVRFRLQKTARGWKITEPDFMPPHVQAAAMIRHLEGTKMNDLAERVRKETP